MNFASMNWFWIVVITWLLLGIIWVGRFRPFIENLTRILTKPIISIKDKNPDDVPFYPRVFLEDIANGLQSKFGKLPGFLISFLFDIIYRIIYVVISISLYFIVTPIELLQGLLTPSAMIHKDKAKGSKQKQYLFKLAVESPRLLSKRFSSPFKVVIYPLTEQGKLGEILVQDARKSDISSYPEILKLKVGTYIVVDLSSQEIEFTKNVIKELINGLNVAVFIGKPKETCYPGTHSVKLSVANKETGHEYISQIFEVKVVDYAFDHISRPFLSGLISIVLGIGSFVTYVLTFLGEVDQVFGLASGTAVALVATIIYGRLFDLYRHTKETTNIVG